jgi:RHH-type proline utilization regulon transcriptional repressor/proline dehydrogenase/delta 1-pyrroline-5-carboxylate dehydrogenase
MSTVISSATLVGLRNKINEAWFYPETEVVQARLQQHGLSFQARQAITAQAASWVTTLRADPDPNLMESFLAEYGLSTDEGIALMCLAEAYLRVPDTPTLDALIRDKIGGADWARHQQGTDSLLINASTWALMLTGKLLRQEQAADSLSGSLRKLMQRMGEPVVRTAVSQAMKVMGQQFVLGRNIDEALNNANNPQGFLHSFDMLGEAARTTADAERYFAAYSKAIKAIAAQAKQAFVHANSGISVKLSALHPRYESVNRERVLAELVPKLNQLAEQASAANIPLNIDAEEAERLDLSLAVIEAVLRNPKLAHWEGFGIVVQAYAKHCLPVLEWIAALASELQRKIAVRLVKGAYWDAEIKQAQVLGLPAYPVFTRKASTDLSYLAGARFLLSHRAQIYPQFATHNAQTLAAILAMAGADKSGFEFQRLHGMGEALHQLVYTQTHQPLRIYAPVGVHEDLLAYLVRRLLENGANSSFVNQLLDTEVPISTLIQDPISVVESLNLIPHPNIPLPPELFKDRQNSQGWNINQPLMASELASGMEHFQSKQWSAAPWVAGERLSGVKHAVFNPAKPTDQVGEVIEATMEQVAHALEITLAAAPIWQAQTVEARAAILEAIAEQYEAQGSELMALLSREAGKTRLDAVLELREAIDFLRYYAAEARKPNNETRQGLGVFVCISPWNFPLAIFTGQIAAALVMGNAVIAKPAEQTPLIADRALQLMLAAGLPAEVIALLPGDGAIVGAALTRDPRIAGVCFTGSIETARLIDRSLADAGNAQAVLIAETGGLNAMIVDSTALPEAAVRDMVNSAFQSAGQRCSALRVLFIQEDIREKVLEMLEGATRELQIADPWQPATDIGPVIDQDAKQMIEAHCQQFAKQNKLLFKHPAQLASESLFVVPTALALNQLSDLEREIFGPVLHVISFKSTEIQQVLATINASGYGLTLGIHSRLDDRVQKLTHEAKVGNIYVNRNQIGAVVGVQPFGGEGLSGTGPKAGGPYYLARFSQAPMPRLKLQNIPIPSYTASLPLLSVQEFATKARAAQSAWDEVWLKRAALLTAASYCLPDALQAPAQQMLTDLQAEAVDVLDLPGPTGESNRLSLYGRGLALCLGGGEQSEQALLAQALSALFAGNAVALPNTELAKHLVTALYKVGLSKDLVAVVEIEQLTETLKTFPQLALLVSEATGSDLVLIRQALAARSGVRVPCISVQADLERFCCERVVTIDTTASGGNASLLTLDESELTH